MARDTTSTTKQAAPLLLRWAARLVLLAFALLVVGALAVVVVIPRATQSQAMTVLTGSMTPGIPVGSVVMVRPVDTGTLRVGDVATYQSEPGKPVYVTHRILKIDSSTTPTSFIFKGDANRGADITPVSAKAIRGEVWFHVPYLGAIRDGLHGKGGFSLVAMLVLAGYALSQVGAGMKERRTKDAPRASDITVNQTLIVATLEKDRLTSRLAMTAREVATAWGAVPVHEDDTTCTLLLAPAEDAFDTALQLLHQAQPLVVRVIDEPGTLIGMDARPLLHQSPDSGRVDA
jgi:signal peptidase